MSGFKTNLGVGLADLLADRHISQPFSASSSYDTESSLPGVTLKRVADLPHRLITITVYPVRDDTGVPNSIVAVQIRSRWEGKDPRPADDLDDAIFAVLQQYAGTLDTGVRVGYCRRISGVSLGPDEKGRHSVSSNYHVSAYWPTSHRS